MNDVNFDQVLRDANNEINFYQEKLKYINKLRDPGTFLNLDQPKNESEILFTNIQN